MNWTRAQFDAVLLLFSMLGHTASITEVSYSRIIGQNKGRHIDLLGVTFKRAGGERHQFHIDRDGNTDEVVDGVSELMGLTA